MIYMEQELSDTLVVLADRLGIATEKVFGIFVDAQILVGVIDIVCIVFAVLAAAFVAKYCRGWCVRNWTDKDGDWNDEMLQFFGAAIPFTSFFFVICVSHDILWVFGESVLRIFAPDYMAAKELIGLLRP